MTNQQPTCKDRIENNLKERIAEFEEGLKAEDFIEWLNDHILAFTDDPIYRAKRLELSYGGPQDYFIFHENGNIYYHFLDWEDGAKRELQGHDYEIMHQVYERITE